MMKTKNVLKILVLTGIFTISNAFYYQTIPDEIYSAFKAGNSKLLAKYFNNNIDLVIIDKEGVYSKSQAELIIKDFFTKNTVNSNNGFVKLHEGGKDASKFIIGTLFTNKGQFRVYILMKTISGNFAIHQLRIEDDSN